MSCSNSHVTSVVSEQNAPACVQGFSLEVDNPLLSVTAPSNSPAPIVDLIGRGVNIAKIAKSVVQRVAVDMVDNIRLLAVRQKPSNAVSKIALSLKKNHAVSGTAFCRASHGASNAIATPDFIRDDASYWVVIKEIANGIRDNFRSHAESPLSVVRGSVVGATDTPILPPFVSSGHKSGDNRLAPCLSIR